MTARLAPILLLAVASAVLAGCTAGSPRYAPEPSLTSQNGATLFGSRETNPVPLGADARNYIAAVDDKRTGIVPIEWDTPLLVSAGSHAIRIARSHGAMGGSVTMQLVLESGKSYVVRAEQRDFRGFHATVWVEEQGSGQIIGDKMALCLDHPASRLADPCK
jgi:hypothetical protein